MQEVLPYATPLRDCTELFRTQQRTRITNPLFPCVPPGKLLPDQLRSITVIRADAYLVSMNNRRLWVLKEARKRGLLKDNTVEVRMQAAQDTKRLKDRFTADKCVLAATFMREPARKAPAEAAALGVEDVWEKDDSEAEEAGERQTCYRRYIQHGPLPVLRNMCMRMLSAPCGEQSAIKSWISSPIHFTTHAVLTLVEHAAKGTPSVR